MLEIRNLRHSFRAPGGGRIPVLDLPELSLGPGDLLVVTGPNGSGKSTLLHVMAGLVRPEAGTVKVTGEDITRLGEPERDRFRARNIGYLLQGAQLLDSLTAEENIMAALWFAGRPARERKAEARRLLDRLGVAHRARHVPAALSGGERQRVALARALANDPPILLADEPLAGLDRDAALDFRGAILRMLREGRTLVVVTHHPDQLPEGTRHLELEPLAREGAA